MADPVPTRKLKRNKGDAPIPWDDKAVRGDTIGGDMVAPQTYSPPGEPAGTAESVHAKGSGKPFDSSRVKKDKARLSPDEEGVAPSGIEYGTKRKKRAAQ